MKLLSKYIISFFLFFTISCLMLYSSYFTSFSKITSNVQKSQVLFQQETMYPKIETILYSNTLDNYTDSLMLNIATTDKEDTSIIEKAAGAFYWDLPENNTSELTWVDSVLEKNTSIDNYSRYWHGYLIILKPLLAFFTYQEIRTINLIGQLVLNLVIALLLAKRTSVLHSLAFLGTLLFFIPDVTGKSLQYSTVIYPTYLAIIYILLNNKTISTFSSNNIFLLLGMSIAFFDLLTYPIVSLIFLLSFDIIVSTKKEGENSLFSSIIVKSFLWGIGYLCMWFSKWIIASVIMKKNIILEAIDRIFLRTGNTTLTFENITFSKVITENFNNIPKNLLLSFLLFYIVSIIILMLFNRITFSNPISYKNIILLIIATAPIIWFFITKNHSFIHNFFTYRNYVALYLPIMFATANTFKKHKI